MTAGRIENSNLPYTPIRSAFTVTEKPLRYFYDRYIPHPEHLKNLKNRNHLGAMVAYHIVLLAAPVTMVVDMVIGIAECIFCTLRGDNLRDVAELARKKIVVSPLQHLTFIIISLTPAPFYFGHSLQMIAVCATAERISDLYWGFAKLSLIFVMGIAAFLMSDPLLSGGPSDIKVFQKIPAPVQPFIQNRLLNMAVRTFFVAQALRNFVLLEGHTATLPILFIMAGITFAITSSEWSYNYTLSQRMIGSFSPSWSHQAFSIFINHGAQLKQVGTEFHADAIDLKPGMTFQDIGFTDHNLSYWKARYIRERFCTQHCPTKANN